MRIEVAHTYQYPEGLSIVIDGFCNHAGYDIERDQFDVANPHGQDQSYDEDLEVCPRCKSWRLVGEETWHGIGVMPL
jgi:hypothetical protein